MNRYLHTMTPRRIIVLLLVSILSICSHALSPELLQQLKQQHIVDTTSTLDNNQIEALKNQNRQLYQQKNIDLKILMIPTIGDTSIVAKQSFCAFIHFQYELFNIDLFEF